MNNRNKWTILIGGKLSKYLDPIFGMRRLGGFKSRKSSISQSNRICRFKAIFKKP